MAQGAESGQPWDATDEERAAADDRLRCAKAFGAFDSELSPEVVEIAYRALERVAEAR